GEGRPGTRHGSQFPEQPLDVPGQRRDRCSPARQPAFRSGHGAVPRPSDCGRNDHRQARAIRATARRRSGHGEGPRGSDRLRRGPGHGTADQRCLDLGRPQRDERTLDLLQHPRAESAGNLLGPESGRAHYHRPSGHTEAGRASQRQGGRPAAASPAHTALMTTLRASGLEKSYKSRKVVSGLSLEVSNGEVVGLLGPNGAGKTTAFYMIVGLVPCDAGRIQLGDTDLTLLPMHRRAQLGLGYLPQEASVFRKLSVENNILAILETRSDLERGAREQRLEELLEERRIGHVRRSLGLSLSGGERRRVEIARALAADPRFMLLDEPFAGVDPLSVLDIQRIIRELTSRGIGVLITDHNVRETLGVCGRAYIVNQGAVIAQGSAEEILANPQVREVYLGQSFRL